MKKLLVLALVCLAVVSCKKEEDDYNNGNNGNTVYTPCPNDSGYTCIPDPNFEQALIDLGYDDVVDGQVSTANISDVDSLNVNSKGITDLTGIDDFSDLNYLYCYDNQLTSLDVSNNIALTHLECVDNQLTCLNVKNGNNTNFTNFYAGDNPNLTCIEVDDPAWSIQNWTYIDNGVTFSTNCNYPAGCF